MILIQDNILPKDLLMDIRKSAIDGGFGTWAPGEGATGQSKYSGMSFHGHMGALHLAISRTLGAPIYPNSSFFRILTQESEKRLIHSDRNDGSLTAIIYLSEHAEPSGTAFYRHKKSGLTEMPSIQEMEKTGTTFKWNEDMRDDSKWEQLDYVSGEFGRLLLFSAPLFHARVPDHGIGTTPEDARMIFVSHMEVG